ncbi:LysR family transcriptional regulator [Marinobacter zhejiangensis]|uniref:DNA-binding transcriptional regulator, LysR family n=1 Tax=Marinobacter zhejiangensis TaxID=488535 RepID=A0A1I4SZE0_9GAMM|nr:LysR family transcriptional regulator [Marinobacter zhejiangensis]SFM69683.1 DNA-binding transcriptional regulator, LysR family [Marinobacter zhejiangensis]
MNIKLDKLRSFVLVAEEGNLTRAAKRRHTTPSAVSEHLRQLEELFGLSLFERSPRGMMLTDAGKTMLVPARQALQQIKELDETARRLRSETPTRLFMGLNAPPEYLKVDQMLRLAARELPDVALELCTSSSFFIAEQVRNGDMDLGFVYGEFADDDIHSIALAPIRVCVVGPTDGCLAFPESLSERRALPWIWPSANCPFSKMMPDLLGGGREQATVVTSSEDEHTTLSMIRAGLGYGVVEGELADHWAERGGIRIYPQPEMSVRLNLLIRRDQLERRSNAAIAALIDRLWHPVPANSDTEAVGEVTTP